jgi:hypothetical protein
MATIFELKELKQTQTPLFLFTFRLNSGAVARWCTHQVEVGGETYEARILGHNLFEMRADSEAGIDSISKLTVTLANADSYGSQIERSTGWKGSKVDVQFLFFDLKSGAPASESAVVFRGIANSPEEVTETTLRLSASNRMNLQRLLAPEVRIQRRCPWKFPASVEQRAEAAEGGERGKYSPFYRCGYSPEVSGGAGSMNGETPYASCDYTRPQCEQRGMFSLDAAARVTRRFGGIEYVPPTIQVRSYGEKSAHASAALENEGRYNDFVPLVYGTAWYTPPIVFARNDGNLTRMEVLLSMGEIQGVLKVLVGDVDIPMGQADTDMTATGWYSVVSQGGRTGGFNPDFADGAGNPSGDPYGSMAFLSLVVPNRVNDGKSLPRVQVLLEGLKVARYGSNGAYLGEAFDSNPAWIILDILGRSGWTLDEIDLASFAEAAAYCAQPIDALDLHGNPVLISRFQCNLVLRRRRSVADVIRGIRGGARLYLTHGLDGRVQLRVENTIALQQSSKPDWSNSEEELDGGWPRYEFGDGATGTGGILRRENGGPAIRFWSRSAADTPNRVSVEFQDAFNEYQQDSLSLVDIDDVLRTGQEISVPLNALGIPNFHQAARIVQLQLKKSVRGNTYAQLETSVRGLGLQPGDLITVTYLKEGFLRQPFRIKSVAPGVNFRTALITAQIHDDAWYVDTALESNPGTRRQPGYGIGLPRPLLGNVMDEEGEPQLGIEETAGEESAEGPSTMSLKVGFICPRQPSAGNLNIPILNLSPTISDSGGSLGGGKTYYYAVSALGGDGSESALSFLVRATIPPLSDTNVVQLTGLSFAPGTAGFHVYRGGDPVRLFRIASDQPVAASFLDAGLPNQLETAPDENFDHANLYWRFEQQPEIPATIHTASTIGNDSLEMPANEYRGMLVRITKGKGKGQERPVASNTATTLATASPWATEPDSSSVFVVAEAGWHFGAMGRTSPLEFEVPRRVGNTVHVSARSANVNDKECAYELSPLTRWMIGSGGGAPLDTQPPGKPAFGMHPTGQGTVEVMGIGFEELNNTRTITAGKLTLHYWNELSGAAPGGLVQAVDDEATTLLLAAAGSAQPGSYVQVDGEIMAVTGVFEGGTVYEVTRGAHGSAAEPHDQAALVYQLIRKVYVLPFPRDFFGSPASGSYCFPVYLPDVRIASAELIVVNARGESEPFQLCLTTSTDYGLRTLSGGQLSIQVEGYLAIQADVAPPLIVEESHSVRDIFAVVRESAVGSAIELRLRQDSEEYCRLTIPAGSTVSNVVTGFGLPPLAAGAQINLDILSVPQGGAGTPGRDLTVTIRL